MSNIFRISCQLVWVISFILLLIHRKSYPGCVWAITSVLFPRIPWIFGCQWWPFAGLPSALSSCSPGWSFPTHENVSNARLAYIYLLLCARFSFWLWWSCPGESGFRWKSERVVLESGGCWNAHDIDSKSSCRKMSWCRVEVSFWRSCLYAWGICHSFIIGLWRRGNDYSVTCSSRRFWAYC